MRDNLFARTELIGLDVEVLSEPFSGISGKVVDETKNTFTIESAGTERMVPKPGNVFRFAGSHTKAEPSTSVDQR